MWHVRANLATVHAWRYVRHKCAPTSHQRAGLRPTGKENSARKPSGNDAGFCDFMAAREATGRLAPGSAAKAAASGGKKVASAAKGAAARAASRTPGSRRGGAPSASARKRKVVRFSLEAAGASSGCPAVSADHCSC